MTTLTSYDVIIIGGGGSGLAAGVSAAEHGASVLLLEKQSQVGGSTGIAVGSFTANRTSLQRSAGIEDSLEAHIEDIAKFPPAEIEPRNNHELRRFFLQHTADTLEWLVGFGLHFQGPNPEPPNRVPRMHNVVPGAAAYIETLKDCLIKKGGVIQVNAPVEDILFKGGRVGGVVAKVEGRLQSYLARWGVVLAAGDYTNAPDLISRFKGQDFVLIEGIYPHATGDGHRVAERVGASLVNMDVTYGPEIRFIAPQGRTIQQLIPARGPLAGWIGRLVKNLPPAIMKPVTQRMLVTWQHPENSLLEDGAILVNQEGKRFCDETRSPEREIAIARQSGKLCYILLDGRISGKYSSWPHFISTAPQIAYAYVRDYLKLRPDVAVRGATLEVVATKRGIPADKLAETVRFTNEERATSGLPALIGDDWVLLGPAKAYFTTTEGSPAINQRMEVLDRNGDPIPGLYAVGQNGLGGQILWGHGLHIAWAMTSGRLAGRHLGRLSSGE